MGKYFEKTAISGRLLARAARSRRLRIEARSPGIMRDDLKLKTRINLSHIKILRDRKAQPITSASIRSRAENRATLIKNRALLRKAQALRRMGPQ